MTHSRPIGPGVIGITQLELLLELREDMQWRPRTDSGTQQRRNVLDWYLEVG